MKKRFSLPILLFLYAPTLFAQFPAPQTLAQLQSSPAGARILQYLDLLNSDTIVSEDAIRALYSKGLLEKYQPKDFVSMLDDVRQRDGQLALYEATLIREVEYALKLRSLKNDRWLDATMTFEKKAPFQLAGFGLHSDAQPAETGEPLYAPAKKVVFREKTVDVAPLAEIAAKTDEIAGAYASMDWFSGFVLLAKDGKPFFEKAYGYADRAQRIPNTANTKFVIGSINKDYTAVLVLQQIQRGVLAFDDRLAKFGLGFPAATADKITIRHLLTHTAGFGDIFIPAYLEDVRKYKTIDDMLPLLRDEPLAYEPGADQRYSNYGYIVLGAILEKISGRPFARLLDENIHAVTGCRNTHYATAEEIEDEARSYRFSVSGEKIDHTAALEIPHPDGGIYATADDLLQFFQTLFYTEKLLSDEYKALFINEYQPSSQSWSELLAQARGFNAYAGGGPGVSAIVGIMLCGNYTAIILANTDGEVTEHIGQRLQAVFRGRPYPRPALPAVNYLYGLLQKNGTAWLSAHFAEALQAGGYGQPDPGLLNQLGYALLHEDKLDPAIEVFTANVALFPTEANPYDSLAEAWLKKGDRDAALRYYRKALELDPNMPSAKRAVKALETQGGRRRD